MDFFHFFLLLPFSCVVAVEATVSTTMCNACVTYRLRYVNAYKFHLAIHWSNAHLLHAHLISIFHSIRTSFFLLLLQFTDKYRDTNIPDDDHFHTSNRIMLDYYFCSIYKYSHNIALNSIRRT